MRPSLTQRKNVALLIAASRSASPMVKNVCPSIVTGMVKQLTGRRGRLQRCKAVCIGVRRCETHRAFPICVVGGEIGGAGALLPVAVDLHRRSGVALELARMNDMGVTKCKTHAGRARKRPCTEIRDRYASVAGGRAEQKVIDFIVDRP